MKKILSFSFIVFLTLILSGGLSYVRAKYTPPSGAPTANNTPAPVILQELGSGFPTGVFGNMKLGKLGITSNKTTNPVDTERFNTDSLVVMGQFATDSLAVNNGEFEIESKIGSSSSINYPLFFGNPTDSSLLQKDGNGKPRLVTVEDHTRAARIVIGSKTANPANYNFYVDPSMKVWGIGYTPGYPHSFCTLNATELAAKGCPSSTYMTKLIPSTTSGANVAECTDLLYRWPDYTGYRGKCY